MSQRTWKRILDVLTLLGALGILLLAAYEKACYSGMC